jgi:D-proline reductase (dithiol) PrdB
LTAHVLSDKLLPAVGTIGIFRIGFEAMARMSDFDEMIRDYFNAMEMPHFDDTPWTKAKPPSESRVAMISTAGLQRRGDRPFSIDSSDYRLLPRTTSSADMVMSHISTNFDRTGFQQDVNVIFPIDRLMELETDGVIGSVADMHYSFMGATHPAKMEQTAQHLAGLLKQDQVDAVLLVPV